MEQKRHSDRIHSLYESLIQRSSNPRNTFSRMINEGIKAFDLEIGIISRIEKVKYTIISTIGHKDIHPGMVFNLENTYCQTVVAEKKIISVNNAGHNPSLKNHPVYLSMSLESYIAAPIIVRDNIWGTINFSSTKVKSEDFSSEDHEFIGLMAEGIASLLEIDILTKEKESVIQSLVESNQILEKIFDNSTIGTAIVSEEGRWIKVNQALTNMLGYTKEYLLSTDFQMITHKDDLDIDLKLLESLKNDEIPYYELEKRYIKFNHESIWCLLSVSMMKDEVNNIIYYISQIQNIDDRKKMELDVINKQKELKNANEELEKMATFDALTGIYNRRKFMIFFSEVKTKAEYNLEPFSLAVIDIDYFKSYNDDFGHQEGDIALKHVAINLTDTLDKKGIVARFGGEEFIVLIPSTTDNECLTACEKLRKSIEDISTLQRKITVSIGAVTIIPKSDCNISFDDIFKITDSKLYEAKRSGRNRIKHAHLEY
ncbi:TPA: diguanylate cyclase [Raoultella ornithinolytica]|nr:diguanylate cyclase [Raoultella ornithinolytica]HDG9799414.1 diguanylate cyclase [Raoultella ornithinolytica]HDG9800437.1 diguanylate cyclase [Raoultella ornithinolytica]HDG9835256.1 diguanylate cyclase [Raoultella ornithinolytica]HDH7811681.1 diguanylate cyclase [Raoultella ornithinolytica]